MIKRLDPAMDAGDRPALTKEEMAETILPYIEHMQDTYGWLYDNEPFFDQEFERLISPRDQARFLIELLYRSTA